MTAPTTGGLEREIKLGAQPGFTMPDLTDVAPGVRVERAATLDLDATYVDTADLRLVRHGVSLRRRTGEGAPRWTLKLPAGEQAGGLSRRELEVDDAGDEVPTELAAVVTGWVRSASLVPVIVIRSHRHRLRLVDADGRDLAEVDDDEVVVVEAGEEAGRFREVEVELGDRGAADLLEVVSAALVAAGAGAPDPTSKVERALGARALVPSELSGPEIDESSTIGDVLTAALRSSLAIVVGNDHAIRLDHLDPDHDGVRRARSALRRFRSDLETFVPILDAAWADALRSGTKELGEDLGVVRGTDVLVSRLLRSIGALAAEQRQAAAEVVRHLEERRSTELAVLHSVMGADRYVALLDELVAAAVTPRLIADESEPAADHLPGLVLRRWRRLERVVEHLGPDPDDESLRRVRSLARRARHAADLAVPVVGSPAALLARGLEGLQEVLGTLQHGREAEDWLRQVMPALGPDERAAAQGLVALQDADVDGARSRWRDAWSACDSKAATGWLR